VPFFTRLYPDAREDYDSYTRQLQPVHAAVMRNLVRKGVLLVGLARPIASSQTKIELWRYRFPDAFGKALPPLCAPVRFEPEAGTAAGDWVRAAFAALVGTEAPPPQLQARLQQSTDQLLLAGRPFDLLTLAEVRRTMWELTVQAAGRAGTKAGAPGVRFSRRADEREDEDLLVTCAPIPGLAYAFGRLGPRPGRWPGSAATARRRSLRPRRCGRASRGSRGSRRRPPP